MATPATEKHTVVEHKNTNVKRVITKKDLDTLVGVKGMHSDREDLVWEHGRSVDVTGLDQKVLDYFRTNKNFTVREVDVPKKNS